MSTGSMHIRKAQLITLALVAAAFAFTSVANAAIKNTRHNMSTSGGWNYTTTGGTYAGALDGDTSEICVFCHTPHGGTNVGVGPLWNRGFNNTIGSYTLYSSWTIDGTNGSVGGAGNYTGSMLCLSCHDGTQAIDTLINAPTTTAANGYNFNGGLGSEQGWSWTESKWMSSGIVGTEVAYIGTDLTDDHPIMIQYGGGGLSSGGGTVGDADFNAPSTAVKGGTTYWYFDTDTSGGMSGADIKMYTYDLGGGVGDEPFVECYTCHDPHVETNRPFLRMSNSDSDLCLTCHAK